MAYDSARGETVLFGGGYWDTALNTTAAPGKDGSTWRQVATTGPGRFNHAMAYDSARG